MKEILCDAYSIPSPVLGAGDTGLHKIDKVLTRSYTPAGRARQ